MGRHSTATERTLRALRDVGRLEEVDAALVALARGLADALDDVDPATPSYPNLVRQYAATLERLTAHDDGADDGPSPLDVALERLRRGAPVGDEATP